MTIEFHDLKVQYRRLKPRIDERIQAVLDHSQYIMGPEIAELEGNGVEGNLCIRFPWPGMFRTTWLCNHTPKAYFPKPILFRNLKRPFGNF